jgi:hypothetical protein
VQKHAISTAGEHALQVDAPVKLFLNPKRLARHDFGSVGGQNFFRVHCCKGLI